MDTFTEYSNHIRQLDTDTYIGWISWYTVRDTLRVNHSKIAHLLDQTGLGRHLPRIPASSDVFRRVCSAAQRKRVPTSKTDVFRNFLLRDPGSRLDQKTIIRRVVREDVDASNNRLGYVEAGEAVFDRDTEQVYTKVLSGGKITQEILHSIVENFKAEANMLNAYAIRELIRRVLVSANAIIVRPGGGVYFVAHAHNQTLDALDTLATELGNEVSFHALPLIDDRRQKEMLKAAFEAESVERVQTLVTEIADLKKKDQRITSDRYASYVTSLNDLKAKTLEYSELLESSLAESHSALQILARQVVGLLPNVK